MLNSHRLTLCLMKPRDNTFITVNMTLCYQGYKYWFRCVFTCTFKSLFTYIISVLQFIEKEMFALKSFRV